MTGAAVSLAVVMEQFTCPDCGQPTRLDQTEALQRCAHCGSFHKTETLLVDGWAR